MRIFLLIVSTLWLLFWLIFGYEMLTGTPRQMESDRLFIEKEINPSVNFVKKYKRQNNRLPTNREYYTWQRDYHKIYESDLSIIEDSLIEGGSIRYITRPSDVWELDKTHFEDVKWSKDFFAIAANRGEWYEYYFSDGGRYDTNNYGWQSSIFSFVFGLFIGMIPLGLWWWKYQRKLSA